MLLDIFVCLQNSLQNYDTTANSLLLGDPAYTAMSRTKVAEPIELPLGLWTRVGPRWGVLGGAQLPDGKGHIPGGCLSSRRTQHTERYSLGGSVCLIAGSR